MANDKFLNPNPVVPSEVENGAAGAAATWTGRPEAERAGSERIKSRGKTLRSIRRAPSTPLRFAQDDCVFVIRASSFISN